MLADCKFSLFMDGLLAAVYFHNDGYPVDFFARELPARLTPWLVAYAAATGN